MRRRLILTLATLCALQLACAESIQRDTQRAAEAEAKVDLSAANVSAASPAQAAIVFDAIPLTATYQRFFGTGTDIFTPRQRKALGTINYVGETHALLHGTSKRQLDQAYLRTLRVVLLSQCQQLATQEAQALSSAVEGDAFTAQVLIKRYGAPQPAEVSAVMSRMFGYRSSAGEHRGAGDYAALMQKNLRDFKQGNSDTAALREEVRQQYVLLCMAIGQDTRVYLR